LGLGCATGLFGLAAFVVQLLTKNIVAKPVEKKFVTAVETERESAECLFYEEFSQGAIEVKDDFVIFYKNWLPFTKCKRGRVSTIIFINDIQHITYKGSGWLLGQLTFTFKHPNKPMGIKFGKWFPWRSIKFNARMTPVYEYLRSRVISNNK
jgi:hypothetical protein